MYVVEPLPPFRSTFPIRYLLMDFGYAAYFPHDWPPSRCVVLPFREGRPQRAPESLEVFGTGSYDPFAADIYELGRLCYGWFFVCLQFPFPRQRSDLRL